MSLKVKNAKALYKIIDNQHFDYKLEPATEEIKRFSASFIF